MNSDQDFAVAGRRHWNVRFSQHWLRLDADDLNSSHSWPALLGSESVIGLTSNPRQTRYLEYIPS